MQNNNLEISRWTVIGRLTASLFHEINNPMQAIHGAMSLVLEELDAPEEVEAYVNLSQKETQRVIELIQRVREIYRPLNVKAGPFFLHDYLTPDIAIISKELKRKQVSLSTEIEPNFPPIWAVPNQIRLLILTGFLTLSETMGVSGGGKMRFSAMSNGRHLCLDYHGEITPPLTTHFLTDYFCQLCQQLTQLNDGQMIHHFSEPTLSLKLTFPLHQPD